MKDSLRRIYIKKRKKLHPDFVKKAGEGIAENFSKSSLSSNNFYMSYYPINNEAPVMELNELLFTAGKVITLPVTNADDSLQPVYLTDFNNYTEGKYKIPEPKDKVFLDSKKIEVVFVPGVVFDRSGGRAGYGKGCYDRFLWQCDVIKIGVCYEFQINENLLNLETHDIRMDYLLTENAIYEV